jgi:hypothetical protein
MSSIMSLGYGTWQAKPGEVSVGVYEALKTGHRHLVRRNKILSTRDGISTGFFSLRSMLSADKEAVLILKGSCKNVRERVRKIGQRVQFCFQIKDNEDI